MYDQRRFAHHFIIHHFTDNINIQNGAVGGKPLLPLKRMD